MESFTHLWEIETLVVIRRHISYLGISHGVILTLVGMWDSCGISTPCFFFGNSCITEVLPSHTDSDVQEKVGSLWYLESFSHL